jgi:transposase InsO family protein
MRYSAHPERQTTFQHTLQQLHLRHGTSMPFKPWQNGIVERSHRTDNEELFHVLRFADAEERRYQLKLWEQEYNWRRPHQSLGGQTPMAVYLQEYPTHAASRMLM